MGKGKRYTKIRCSIKHSLLKSHLNLCVKLRQKNFLEKLTPFSVQKNRKGSPCKKSPNAVGKHTQKSWVKEGAYDAWGQWEDGWEHTVQGMCVRNDIDTVFPLPSLSNYFQLGTCWDKAKHKSNKRRPAWHVNKIWIFRLKRQG